MKTPNSTLFVLVGSVSFILSGCPQPAPVPPVVGAPLLEADSPFDLEESPKGISVRKTWVLKNTGDSKMRVTDFELEPDDGVFTVGISRLPFNIERGEEKEITVTFRPTAERAYTAELSLDYNHGQVFTPDPLELKGLGISNLVCRACEPVPEPECRLEGEVSVYYEPTSSTDCENEDGICSYLMMEEMCEHGLCDEDTQQCPRPEGWDSGEPVVDAGQAVVDSGQHTIDAGHRELDAGEDIIDSGHTPIVPVLCLENEYVFNERCESCPAGTTNAAGDDTLGGNTACDATMCGANQYVLDNACESCPAGTTNAADDDASEGNTACDATLCGTDQYVLNNVCTPCSGSDINVAGDDASGINTTCDSDLCIGFECGENASCISTNTLNNLCECLPGYQDNNEDGDCVLTCADTDLDDVCNDVDNCSEISNATQANYDGDALGDACDSTPYQNDGDLAFLNDFVTQCGLTNIADIYNASFNANGRLYDLIQDDTNLNCEIPESIGNATQLWRIVLRNNNLFGSIPDSIGNLINLEVLWLNDNNLSGPLPNTFWNLTAMTNLTLINNNLSGSIPSDIENLSELQTLWIHENEFEGVLPSEVCNLSNLSSVILRNNNFCPTYPSCLTGTQIGSQDTSNCD